MNTFSALVLDDDVEICRMLNLMLPSDHYEVQFSHSVADALAFRSLSDGLQIA